MSQLADKKNGRLISFDEAINCVFELAKPLGTESVVLDNVDGRYLARSVIASRPSPTAAVAAMDGYAVRDADVMYSGVCLEIIGRSFAGASCPVDLRAGTCVHIFTGAPVPQGTDRVVVQENVRVEGRKAFFAVPPSGRNHIRHVGSDFVDGDLLVAAGCQLNPQSLISAAAADLAELEVVRRPRVFVICCGDELSEPGDSKNHPGTIPESTSFGVIALARRYGADIVGRLRIRDELEKLQAAAANALELADVIVVIGGASVGEKDFAKDMFVPQGLEIVFSKVAIRPGKPVWMGMAGKRIVMGLPGNPASALITARLFLAPLLMGMAGGDARAALKWGELPLMSFLGDCDERETFLRARDEAGAVAIMDNQDSASQKAIGDCNLLVRRRAGAPPASSGTLMETIRF